MQMEEKTIKMKPDTVRLFNLVVEVLTDEKYGYKWKEGDETAYSDEKILHVIIEDFYDKLAKIALKSGYKLP